MVDLKNITERGVWWIMFRGSRLAVAGGILVGFIVLYLIVGSTEIFIIGTTQRLLWLMNGIVNGILTLVTVVIAVNQLILSQEFGSVGQQHEQVEAMVEFREHVEEKIESLVSQPQPAAFLGSLFQALSRHTQSLQEESQEIDNADQQFYEAIEEYGNRFGEQLEETATLLNESHTDRLTILSVILDYNDSAQLYATRQLRAQFESVLSPTMTDTLEKIEELIVDLDTSRQYFKTTYIQRELAILSRRLIYTGLLSVSVAGLVIMSVHRPTSFQISSDLFTVFMSIIIAVTLSPLAILAASILRIATIAEQTAAFGPFIPKKSSGRE